MDKIFIVIGLVFLIGIVVFVLAVMSGWAGFSMTNTKTGESKRFGSCKEDE